MTTENTYREKGRAVFLAVMMVLSVIAMSAAFAGGAAAEASFNDDNYNEGPHFEDSEGLDSEGEVWAGQTFSIDTDNIEGGPYDVELRQGLNPDNNDAEFIDDDSHDDGVVSFDTDDIETDRNYHLNFIGVADEDDVNYPTFEVVEEELDVDFASSTVVDDGEIDIDFESERDDQWVNVTSDDFDGEELFEFFDPEEQDVADNDGGINFAALYTEDDTFEVGDSTDLDYDGDNSDYEEFEFDVDELHEDDDVLTIVGLEEGDNALTANFDDVSVSEGDEPEFYFDNTDSLASDNASVEITDDADDREFIDVDEPEEGEIANITAEIGNSDEVAIELGDYDDENHESTVILDTEDNDDDEVEIRYNTALAALNDAAHDPLQDAFEDIEVILGGTPVMTVADAIEDDLIEPGEAEELLNDELGEDQVIPETDWGEYEVGGWEIQDDYQDNVSITDSDLNTDLETTANDDFDWNSYVDVEAELDGLDPEVDEVTIDDELFAALETDFLNDDGPETLPAASWDLDIGSVDENNELDEEDDRDNLLITDRMPPGDAIIQTAPDDAGIEDLDDYEDETVTESDTIATDDDFDNSDSLFMSVDNFGANGSVEALDIAVDGDSEAGGEIFSNAGVSLEIAEQDTSAVGDETVWNTSHNHDFEGSEYNGDIDHELPADVYTLDDYDNELIVEIKYDELEDDAELEVGETYDIYFNISSEYSDLAAQDYSDPGEITFEEPEVEWDEIDELEASAEANATGTTNVAPGSEIAVRADSPSDEGAFVDHDDAEVNSDGVFEASFDLEGEELGSLFDLEADEPLDVDDDDLEDVELVEATDDEDDDEGITLDVDYDDTIDETETADIDATVDNNEEDNVTVNVSLEIGDETYDRTVDIDGESSATETFSLEGEELGVDEHDFTVDADSDDDSASYDGTLTVNEVTDDDDDAPADDEDDADDDDAPEDDDDDDDDDDDGTPGFGVAVALVALLSAAMLALRRQD